MTEWCERKMKFSHFCEEPKNKAMNFGGGRKNNEVMMKAGRNHNLPVETSSCPRHSSFRST